MIVLDHASSGRTVEDGLVICHEELQRAVTSYLGQRETGVEGGGGDVGSVLVREAAAVPRGTERREPSPRGTLWLICRSKQGLCDSRGQAWITFLIPLLSETIHLPNQWRGRPFAKEGGQLCNPLLSCR